MSPDAIAGDPEFAYRQFPVGDSKFDTVEAFHRMEKGDTSWFTPDFMQRAYLRNLDFFGKAWGDVIRLVADPGSLPLVFHCTAGKDRAGTFAAMLLLALGVPEDVVIEDHALSNRYIEPVLKIIYPRLEKMGVDTEKVSPYFTAPKEAIVAALTHLRERYDSIENYLYKEAGVGEGQLRQLKDSLLEP
jgi:protein-tyrosine phosphatase